jgi:hypothetical protein
MNEIEDFKLLQGIKPYSKEQLEEGKKYYGWIRVSKDGIEELDWDKNQIKEIS